MGVKIAIGGKGGVGKTTVCAVWAQLFADEGFDVLAIDADPNTNLALAFGISSEQTGEPLIRMKQLIAEIFPELAKLSPQGTVHAATLYSAVNIAMRTPPGPMLAELVSSGEYSPVGDNYWVLRVGGV